MSAARRESCFSLVEMIDIVFQKKDGRQRSTVPRGSGCVRAESRTPSPLALRAV